MRSAGRPVDGPGHMPPGLRTITRRRVALRAWLASTSSSNWRPTFSGPVGRGTWRAAASREMRAQWRSKANRTPSATRIVVKTPQPESRPTWPGERPGSEASQMRSLWSTKRCSTKTILARRASCPIGKGIGAGFAAGGEERGKTAAASMEAIEELGELVFLAVDPIGRDALPRPIDDLFWEVNHLVKPGAEIVEGADRLVDLTAVIQALDGGFGKVPVGAVESEAVVDHEEIGRASCRERE